MKKRFAVAGLATLIVLALGGVAWASIPGPDGVIHGCYKTSGGGSQGDVIVIDSAVSCPSGYTALNWNQIGPPGQAGTDGVSGYQLVGVDHSVTEDDLVSTSPLLGRLLTRTAECPTGKVPVGGGGTVATAQGQFVAVTVHSFPTSSGWSVTWGPGQNAWAGSQPWVAHVDVACIGAA